MVRDVLSMLDIDSEFDFSRKGGGGERELIKKVSADIKNDYDWWWCPDIKNCFGSILPGHFGWLPIDRRIIKNIFFLPKCAKVMVAKPNPKDMDAILLTLGAAPSSISYSVGATMIMLHALTVQHVRRGLLQGSVLSPLLARAVIAKELKAAIPEPDVSKNSYCDDLVLGAKDEEGMLAAKQAVTKRFSSLPAGQLELHTAPITRASSGRLDVLGYRLQPGNGYGDTFVHSKPARKRTDRHKRRLAELLKAVPPEGNLYEVGEKYWAQWFGSQSGWTKVPLLSANVSLSLTFSYITDFIDGVPMGVCKVNKPPGTSLTKKVGHPAEGSSKSVGL